MVRGEAYLGARWLVAEAREEAGEDRVEEEDRGDQAGGGRARDAEVCKDQGAAGGRGVRGEEAGRGARVLAEVLGTWGLENP